MTASVEIHPGDNRESLRRLIDQGVRVHAVLTDPPYGLVSIEKRFGKQGAAAAKTEGNDGSFSRLSRGFMGSTWDGTGIERDPEFWALILEILLPGGFCLAFSGASTGHRQACAMEDAGFVMHEMMAWVHGQGFPKGKDVCREMTKINSDEASKWDGWKFGGQARKPAIEPIYVAQRPLSEKGYVRNILRHGVGAVNIAGCRVPLHPVADARQLRTMNRSQRTEDTSGQTWGLSKNSDDLAQVVHKDGRYPATLLHDGSNQVVDLFPKDTTGAASSAKHAVNADVDLTVHLEVDYSTSTARFFNAFPTTEDCPPLIYHPKASKGDRAGSQHPTVKPIGLLRHLIRHITPPGGVILDPFAGSGTTAAAAQAEGVDCILMEAEQDYIDFLHKRFGKNQTGDGSGVQSDSTDLSDLLIIDNEEPLLV